MKEKLTTIYKCDFCNKNYLSKRFAIQHEKMCSKNPANHRLCYDCKFLKKKKVYSAQQDDYGGNDIQVEIFFCSKKEIALHRPQNTIKNNVIELSDYENVEMVIECNDFESDVINLGII